MAMQRLAHPDGELATSRAAAAEGIPMVRQRYDGMHLNAAKIHTDFLVKMPATATRKHSKACTASCWALLRSHDILCLLCNASCFVFLWKRF